MKQFLNDVRRPDADISMRTKVIVSVIIAAAGALLGILQKWLDSQSVNELPSLLQTIDITNYFGRSSFWIFASAVIAAWSSSPVRAGINVFLFLMGMVGSYYLYCSVFSGFLPVSYMMIWAAIAVISPLPAFFCWYARGKGKFAVTISAGILGVLLAQAVILTQGIYVTHLLDVMTFAAALIVFRRKLKETLIEAGAAVVIAVLYQLVIPYWG